ncbi:DUF4230 domain-containing protein [candidate division WOR-3 bacterium]|nr:DUF4230 domain-containing protein [candidate division WOR-3 bacterium]
MLKKYSLFVTVALSISVIAIIVLLSVVFKSPGEKKVVSTLEILRSEQLVFLVTDKIVTQVIVHVDNSHWLTGTDRALLYTIVTIYYGVDLKKLTEDDLERRGDTVFVDVPEPQILDISVDLKNIQVFESKSGLVRLVDLLKGENTVLDLLTEFEISSRKLAEDAQMFPSREKLLSNLNSFAPLFSEQTGLIIIFR